MNQFLPDGAAARTQEGKIDAARLSPPAVGTSAPLFELSSSLFLLFFPVQKVDVHEKLIRIL